MGLLADIGVYPRMSSNYKRQRKFYPKEVEHTQSCSRCGRTSADASRCRSMGAQQRYQIP
jgi:hypothetical protein